MNDPLKIIGANGKRRENDFYPTPPECTYALLDYLRQNFLLRSTDTIWEPACGNNAMVDVMVQQGHSVIATDITQGQDFLEYEMQDHFDWMITNPPFYLSEKFIKRCIEYGKPFALLLKSQYWHSAKRRELFHSQPPPICIAVDMETRLHRKRLVYDGYGMDRVDRQLKEHILRAPCKTEKNGGSEMKAVMLSIQPKWCEKIASGEKTVEVRKTRPNIVTPFKCYIYQTKGIVPMLGKSNEHWKTLLLGKGKVIGEFVCDKIIFAEYGSYAKFSRKDTQLDADDLMDYADGKPVFGWHISDLVIYDKPKELGEFQQCHKCPHTCVSQSKSLCEYHRLKRPPQSWCYVEVQE